MKSISKIRHIQESNRILENRLLNEQPDSNTVNEDNDKSSSGSIKDLHLYYISALQDEMVDNASIFFEHPRVFRAGIYRILEHAKERLSDEEYKKLVEYCEELMNSMTDDKN
jgi:hypothetical protein